MRGLHDELRAWGWDGAEPDRRSLVAFLEEVPFRPLAEAVKAHDPDAARLQARLLMEQAARLGLNPIWAAAYPLNRSAPQPEKHLRALYLTLRQLRDILRRY